jgi:hypothetical protein
MSDDIAWFEQNRPTISKQYPDMYVIVKNKTVVGAYPDYATAYSTGTQMFGTEPFVVKQATASQQVETMTYNYLGRAYRDTFAFARRLPFMGQGAPQPAELVERLRQDGALVNVQIAVPAAYAKQLTDAGKPVPPPQVIKAMIDTGASISTVSDAVAASAGLQQVGSVPIGGVGGMSTRPIYSASFGLPDYKIQVDPIEIAGVSLPVGGFDALVGRDILRALEFDYTGTRGAFLLTQNPADQGTPAAPGQPVQLLSTQGLSPLAWAGIGVGSIALIGGGLWLAGVFKKK